MAEPFGYPDVGAAMPEAYGAGSGIKDLLAQVLLGTAQIPKRVIDAAAGTAPPGLRREDYTDMPAPQGGAPFGLSPQAWQPGDEQRAATMDAAVNLAGIGAPAAATGAAGVFGGRLAKTADLAALKTAEEMHAAGADRSAIWDKTGWFKGGDDKWRFEIPDYQSQMNQTWHDKGVPNFKESTIAGQLWHKPLYDAYPDLRNARAVTEKGRVTSGSYNEATPGIGGEETINMVGANAPAVRSVALHEVQHAIQNREGFAQGSNPTMFSGDKAQAVDQYHRTAGEVEARNVQMRKDIPPDMLRGKPPWLTEDVPAADQIVRLRGGPVGALDRGPQMSAPSMDAAAAARAKPDGMIAQKGDVSISKKGDQFIAEVDGKRVGSMSLSWRGPYATSVEVASDARRRGIATHLYDAAESVLGRPVVPSPLGISDEAMKLWKRRLSGLDPETRDALLKEAAQIGADAGVGKSALARMRSLGLEEK